MPPILNPQAELKLGALDLMGRDRTGPFWFQAFATNAAGTMDLGTPEAVEREIESLLQDGTIVVVDSYGNRAMTIPVSVYGEDAPALAAGELALMAEVRRRNVLAYTPANIITGAGDVCIFDVVNSEPAPAFDASVEVTMLRRTYLISIKALPHARSPFQRTATMAAPAGLSLVTAEVNDCTSLTGWAISASVGPSAKTLVTSGGSVKVDWANTSGMSMTPGFIAVALSGLSADMTATPYVRLDFTFGGDGRYSSQPCYVYINDQFVTATATNGSIGWYRCPDATLHKIEIYTEAATSQFGKLHIYVADVSRSNIPGDSASGTRQLFGTVAVAGSVRTEATLSVVDETPAALGSVLVYTAPDTGLVAQPPLRARRAAGPTETPDASLVSGKSSDLGTNHAFDIPVRQVPDGTYLLMARVKNASAGPHTITWDAKARMGGNDVATVASGTTQVTITAGAWTIVVVALTPFPGETLGDAGIVRIDLAGPAGLLLDEAWLFNTTVGELSWVECGTGTPAAGGPASHLWVDPASLERPSVSVTIGTADDRTDSFAPAVGALVSCGSHEFVPPSMTMFVVTTNSVAMQVEGAYFPRFHTYVLEDTSG